MPADLNLLYIDRTLGRRFSATRKGNFFETTFRTDAPLGRPEVCAATCGIARACSRAQPDGDEGRRVCVAVFTLSCDAGWKLHVDAQPSSAFRYSRRETLPQPAREGDFEVPGDLCDVGIGERLSIHIRYGGIFIGAVPISFDALRREPLRLDREKIKALVKSPQGEPLIKDGTGATKYLEAAKAKAAVEALKAKDYVAFKLQK